MEKLLTLKDVCELLQVSPSLVYKWVHYGHIPHIKLGTAVRFKESALTTWLKSKEKKGRLSPRITIEV
jgi:excisionase family DNA binding protein